MKLMRVALYLRYSSKKQNRQSIEDQKRSCLDYCAKNGMEVAFIYIDAERSGKSIKGRDQFQQMLRDCVQPDHPYDAVVIFHVDRLARRVADATDAFDRLEHAGVELHCTVHGKMNQMVLTMLSMIAQQQSQATAIHTRKAQQGSVIQGKSSGGLAYGYRVSHDHIKNGKILAGYLKIVPEEATVLVRIGEEFARGDSPELTARRLNAEGILGPGGRPWSNTTIRGQAKRGTGILNNRLYNGERVWGRCSYKTSPDGNRDARPVPESEWLVEPAEDLRIFSRDLWARIKARQQAIAAKRTAATDSGGNPISAARRNMYLLTGLVRCCECGGNYTIIGKDRYGCATRKMKGTCANTKTIGRQALEGRVLAGLKDRLLEPDALATFITAFEAEMKVLSGKPDRAPINAEKQKKQIEQKIANMMKAIEDGLYTEGMKARMAGLEAELRTLQTASTPAPKPAVERLAMPELPALFRKKVLEMERLLEVDATRSEAMELIRSLVSHVDLRPTADGRGMDAELHGELAGILAASEEPRPGLAGRGSKSDVSQIVVVAGTGFEPVTFRL